MFWIIKINVLEKKFTFTSICCKRVVGMYFLLQIHNGLVLSRSTHLDLNGICTFICCRFVTEWYRAILTHPSVEHGCH